MAPIPENPGIYLLTNGRLARLGEGDIDTSPLKISPEASVIIYDRRSTLLDVGKSVVLRRLEQAPEPGQAYDVRESIPFAVEPMDEPDMFKLTPVAPLKHSVYRVESFGEHYLFSIGKEASGPKNLAQPTKRFGAEGAGLQSQGFVWEPGPEWKNSTRPKELNSMMDQAADYFKEASRLFGRGRQVEAARLTRQAAELGYAEAQCSLGALYMNGQGVDKDQEAAFQWFLKAARQGHSGAQCNLGLMYQFGQGVKRDLKEAADWYRKAADRGHSKAENGLAWILATSADPELLDGSQAVDYAQRAVTLQPEKGEYVDTLAAAYARCGKFSQAVEWENKVLQILEETVDLPEAQRTRVRTETNHRLELYEKGQPFVE